MRPTALALATMCVISVLTGPSLALPLAVPAAPPDMSAIPAKGLLCGGGWHYSFYYFKCIRNRHHCPAGQHWISLLKVCV